MTAPTFSNLTNGGHASTFVTASVSPTGNRLILVTIHAYVSTGSVNPGTPTVTGNGITYTLEKAQDVDTSGVDRATMWVFRGMAASPSAGAITIASFGAVTPTRVAWSVDQSDANVDTTGTNGSGAIVQSVGALSGSTATSLSINYAPAITAGNSGFSAFGHQVQEVKSPRASWTELADNISVTLANIETQYRAAADTAGSATWVTGSRAGGIIVEVKTGVPAGGGGGPMNPAAETDAAQAFGRQKLRASGVTAETDTAQPVTRGKLRALGASAETEAAVPVSRVKRKALGVAAETDTATLITSGGKAALPALETDTALPVGRRKLRAVGTAVETETASVLARAKRRLAAFAAEVEAAVLLARGKRATVGPAAETDSARPAGRTKARLAGAAAEADTAVTIAADGGAPVLELYLTATVEPDRYRCSVEPDRYAARLEPDRYTTGVEA